jgi:hypothetical protein
LSGELYVEFSESVGIFIFAFYTGYYIVIPIKAAISGGKGLKHISVAEDHSGYPDQYAMAET